MQIPYRLTRREHAARPDAYLLTSTRIDALIRHLVGSEPLATVFRVRGGFLVVPAQPASSPVPGAIRLRRLAGDFYIPADSDLSPALLRDESIALTQSRGLIFLPGGDKLAFDPNRALVIECCFQPLPVLSRDWQSFPQRPSRPDELKSLRGPEPTVGAVLEIGRPDGSEPLAGSGDVDDPRPVPEDARPPAGSFSQRIKANTKLRLGQFLNWLGRQTGMSGLSRTGANLAREALEKVPRLSEKVLGDQEAALREVLRQLREGDVEKGLRRAPIAVGDPDAPASIDTGSDLGSRDPRYSLRNLIFSGGRASTWLGGGDVWNELAKEYRRLAQEAVKRGDFRRAAYLHGVLLRDLYTAANLLRQGGLHRDAAILYRDRLKNLPQASASFEEAGDLEESLRIRLQLDDFEQAARLYRKLGYETEAVETYTRAAEQLAAQGKWARAGQLMRWEAKDRVLAVAFYRQGWETPHVETVLCGQRLLEEFLDTEDWDRTNGLLAQAEETLRTRGPESGSFFNHALTLQEFFPLERREAVKDRIRLHFAEQVRSQSDFATAKGRTELLFAKSDHWSGSLLRDALYAANRHRPAEKHEAESRHLIRLTSGTVRAVVISRGTFDLVVASDTEIVCWRPQSGQLQTVSYFQSPRLGLATDFDADHVYLLTAEPREEMKVILKSFALHSRSYFAIRPEVILGDGDGTDWTLAPQPITFEPDPTRMLPVQSPLRTVFAVAGLALDTMLDARGFGSSSEILLCERGNDQVLPTQVWKLTDREVRFIRRFDDELSDRSAPLHARFGVPPGSTLTRPPFDWVRENPRVLEVVGLDSEGVVHWSRFEITDLEIEATHASLNSAAGFVVTCMVRARLVAAVDRKNVLHWLRPSNGRLIAVTSPTPLSVSAQVIVLASRPHVRELIAVLEDGHATRIDLP